MLYRIFICFLALKSIILYFFSRITLETICKLEESHILQHLQNTAHSQIFINFLSFCIALLANFAIFDAIFLFYLV
jgi:flagellar biosynthesis protein FlhB